MNYQKQVAELVQSVTGKSILGMKTEQAAEVIYECLTQLLNELDDVHEETEEMEEYMSSLEGDYDHAEDY